METKTPYDQRKVQMVAGIMAAFAMRAYDFDVDIKISAGTIKVTVTDFQRGEVKGRSEQHIDVWSCTSDHHAYVWGYNAALRGICQIEHAKGNCVS